MPITGSLKVLIAAGGSGGHLFPAQQLAALLHSDCQIAFIGHALQNTPFFSKGALPFLDIASMQPKWGNWLRFFTSSCKGFWQSLMRMRQFRPDVVIGFGSYHTFPVLLAAALLRKKIILFEANCILGKVNRLFAPIATTIALQFPLARPLTKSVFVPYLPWIHAPRLKTLPADARAYFHLDPHRRTILVFGGSQGAAFINQNVPKALVDQDVQVIHLTGKGQTAVSYGKTPACVKEFEQEMELAYTAADLVICRSGASTVAELIRAEIPALLIPFPHAAENHQWENGQFLAHRVQGARLLAQNEASPMRIAREVALLWADKEGLKASLIAWNRKAKETMDFGALVRRVGSV